MKCAEFSNLQGGELDSACTLLYKVAVENRKSNNVANPLLYKIYSVRLVCKEVGTILLALVILSYEMFTAKLTHIMWWVVQKYKVLQRLSYLG